MVSYLRVLAPLFMVAGIAIRTSERRLIERLEAANATSPDRAIALPLTHFLRKWVFQRLLMAGAVGETMAQTQYLNLPAYTAFRARRRKRALVVIMLVVALGVAAYWYSTHTA